MIMIDYTQYVIVFRVGKKQMPGNINYKSIKIDDTPIFFVPPDEVKKLDRSYKMLKFSWKIMKPIMKELLDKDWDFKFENDADFNELERINGEFDTPEKRLEQVEKYFEENYKWPEIADPILHTRLIITPPISSSHIVIYYGETVDMQDTSETNIVHFLGLIWKEYKKSEGENIS